MFRKLRQRKSGEQRAAPVPFIRSEIEKFKKGLKKVKFCFYENPMMDIFFSLKPGYEELASEMIAYADAHMSVKGEEIQLMLFGGQDVEPLCTIPEYRHRGLASAAMFELYRRMKPLGATHMTGGFHQFYKAIGYNKPAEKWTYWKKQ